MLFNKLFNKLCSKCKNIIENCQEDKNSKVFFLKDFIAVLLFNYFNKSIDSLRCLVRKLEENDVGIDPVAYSTLRDAFSRFDYQVFQQMLSQLLLSMTVLQIPELSIFGQICLVDGSIFPVSISMDWAEFRKNKKAVKLHLIWNLNGMIAEDLVLTNAITSEIQVLKAKIQTGITYVCDRGYVSFDLFNAFVDEYAYFIIRLRSNALFDVLDERTVRLGLRNIRDQIIVFKNDSNKNQYRIVSFKLEGKRFYLVTNRFHLKVEDIIMLYACRWQVELIFRFLKRTLGGIHLCNESENGILIQLYMMQISYLFMLRLKQQCQCALGKKVEKIKLEDLYSNPVFNFGERTKKNWKIGKIWLEEFESILNKRLCKRQIKKLAE